MLFKLLKRYLVRKWAIDIAKTVGTVVVPTNHELSKNIAGAGGQRRPPYGVTWQSLFDQCDSIELKVAANNKRYLAVKEFLFFAYLGPLEAWCERNFAGPFMLWSDDHGIHCMLFDTQDRVLWQLTWGNTMPRYKEMSDYYS
jgi:hypothetical protein